METWKPEGYSQVTPYLTVVGADKQLDFLVAVFDAKVIRRVEREDEKILHAAALIGDAHVELSEHNEKWGPMGMPMPSAIHIYVPDIDATHRKALEAGAEVLHEPMDMDYGERASAVRDPSGTTWYIASYRGGGTV